MLKKRIICLHRTVFFFVWKKIIAFLRRTFSNVKVNLVNLVYYSLLKARFSGNKKNSG